MTFPTEADIEFFKEAKRIQELWEPRVGDCIHYPQYQEFSMEVSGWRTGYVCSTNYGAEVTVWQGGYHNTQDWFWWPRKEVIWLPRPDQLWEMLEERGWIVGLDGPFHDMDEDERYLTQLEKPPLEATDDYWAATPAIALGRALIGLLEEEK